MSFARELRVYVWSALAMSSTRCAALEGYRPPSRRDAEAGWCSSEAWRREYLDTRTGRATGPGVRAQGAHGGVSYSLGYVARELRVYAGALAMPW